MVTGRLGSGCAAELGAATRPSSIPVQMVAPAIFFNGSSRRYRSRLRKAGLRAPRPFAQSSATRQPGSTSGVQPESARTPTRMTALRGQALLADLRLNKQSAFSDSEREELGLVGLLPQRVETIDQQLLRVRRQLSEQPSVLAKNVYLRELHDRNETLFYRLLIEDLPELMPIVYTPTVGEAIREYSHAFRRPAGVSAIRWPDDVPKAFANLQLGPDDVDLIVATDSEAILGIGDWGSAASTLRLARSASTSQRPGGSGTRFLSCWMWGPTAPVC